MNKKHQQHQSAMPSLSELKSRDKETGLTKASTNLNYQVNPPSPQAVKKILSEFKENNDKFSNLPRKTVNYHNQSVSPSQTVLKKQAIGGNQLHRADLNIAKRFDVENKYHIQDFHLWRPAPVPDGVSPSSQPITSLTTRVSKDRCSRPYQGTPRPKEEGRALAGQQFCGSTKQVCPEGALIYRPDRHLGK